MYSLLKQSTARNVMIKLYLTSDHVSAATGKTLTVTLSKDGAAFGALSGSASEVSSGWYKVALNTTDTNTLGTLVIRATATSCDDAEAAFEVTVNDPSIAWAPSSTALSTAQWSNTRAGYLDNLSGHVAQTGDSYARIGAPAGASISADIQTRAESVTALSTATWTGARAGYLDNINGHVAQTGDSYSRIGAPAGASISADIAAKLATSGYTAPDNASITAIKAKTDNLPASPAATSDILTQVDAALDAASVELTAVPSTTGSIREFIQFLHAYFRNKKTVTSTTETLLKEDASTTLGTATISDNGTTFSKGELG